MLINEGVALVIRGGSTVLTSAGCCIKYLGVVPIKVFVLSSAVTIFCVQVRYCQSSQSVPAARLPYRVKLSAGKRYAWCACGHSKKQVSDYMCMELTWEGYKVT